MGLDVYLYKCCDRDKAARLENEYENRINVIYKQFPDKYEDWTEEEKNRFRAERRKLADELGLDGDGQSPDRIEIVKPSVKYPDHPFKVGYFRSSYNSGGINNILRELGIDDLYDIFPEVNNGDAYNFAPDWNAALVRCQDVQDRLREIADSKDGKVRTLRISLANYGNTERPKTAFEAREIYLREKSQYSLSCSQDCEVWGSAFGVFIVGGLKALAVLKGDNDSLGYPQTFLVYEANADQNYEWYIQALEIVRETIEYVLRQADKEDYYLTWSA